MAPSRQLGLGPMALQTIASVEATDGNSVAKPKEINFGSIWLRTFSHCELSNQQAAGMLGMSDTNFTKAFSSSPKWVKHNPTMKKLGSLEPRILQAFATFLAAECGMTVTSDAEDTRVKVAFAEAHLQLVNRAVQR